MRGAAILLPSRIKSEYFTIPRKLRTSRLVLGAYSIVACTFLACGDIAPSPTVCHKNSTVFAPSLHFLGLSSLDGHSNPC